MAQLDSVSASDAEGCGFDPRRVHHTKREPLARGSLSRMPPGGERRTHRFAPLLCSGTSANSNARKKNELLGAKYPRRVHTAARTRGSVLLERALQPAGDGEPTGSPLVGANAAFMQRRKRRCKFSFVAPPLPKNLCFANLFGSPFKRRTRFVHTFFRELTRKNVVI